MMETASAEARMNKTTTSAVSTAIPSTHKVTKWGQEHAARTDAKVERATFGAGCFWGVEALYRRTPGVIATAVGYSGGHIQNPSYKQVCTDTTGHAEVVDVVFDPSVISFEQLARTFFENHDATQVDRQGPDYGTQYRTAIFAHNDAQRAAAERLKAELAPTYRGGKRPIATQVVPFDTFWAAEDYHQQYLEKQGLDTCGTH